MLSVILFYSFILSICSPMANSIYFSLHSKFDICSFHSHSIWICATFLPRRAYRVAKQHIEPQAISSDTKWHISMLKLLFAKTNNSFNIAKVGYLDCKFYGVFSELVFVFGHLSCSFVLSYLSICSPLANSIFARGASNRYMLTLFAFDMDMCHLLAPQGISSCEATYRAVGYIE